MSAFTPKRKAKVIKVLDDDEDNTTTASPASQEPVKDDAAPVAVKFTRKPFRQSGLRKSINFNNEPDDDSNGGKKRKSTSRLSFGGAVGDADSDDAAKTEYTTPKKSTLGYQAFENSALKNRLPMRTFRDEEEDRPRYSKEYLSELQNSTPNTPQNLTSTTNNYEPTTATPVAQWGEL
ncbi:hypothetical protein CH063_13417 [Colletotrichum higginsianum]|uniref:Uncharacterized protein n=1 Tax=Colletotrichum higginsianum (strain IMI 349063) TaxID=759273 RepID=H1VUB5_COLHI|nr:hypothetical protein CH063_13417 [Colletotrichum higginsianum]